MVYMVEFTNGCLQLVLKFCVTYNKVPFIPINIFVTHKVGLEGEAQHHFSTVECRLHPIETRRMGSEIVSDAV
jgi:hypothetical protein